MHIDQITTFLDLCDTRSFHRTAERLGVTQSTISGRVAALERALGCVLLTRSRSGTDLTTQGLRFEPRARSLAHTWTEARHIARDARDSAIMMRIGLQHDLAGERIAQWVEALRSAIPDIALYVEADFSNQMCVDVMAGDLDLAMVFTPRIHPDLYFESLGEAAYRMVSTDPLHVDAVRAERYILPNYAPAFTRTHAELFPLLSAGPISSGQGAVVQGLLLAMGGATYLPTDTARQLLDEGRVMAVEGAPRITQPVYATTHLRNRHRRAYRRMIAVLRKHLT
ncbi:MAG: LysR family transcriptional regulator [Paracoccaceae bacterium]